MKGIFANAQLKTSCLFFALTALVACGSGGNDAPADIIADPVDHSPDTFSFDDQTAQNLAILVESNVITVAGINAATEISISGGEYSIDGGTFLSSSNTVENQQEIVVRQLSSASYSGTTDAVLSIGDTSDTFSVTTRGQFTRFASEINNDTAARFAVVEQPAIGRIIVSPDLTELTYEAMTGYDFLQPGETAKETVTVSLIGEENIKHELSFNLSGVTNSPVCEDREVIDLMPNETWPNGQPPYTDVADGVCVRLDASSFNEDNHWQAWTGDNGAARPSLFSVIGADIAHSTLTFLPPAGGNYHISWCPSSGECVANFYFKSETRSTEKQHNIKLVVDNSQPGEEILLTVTENNSSDMPGFTYRWIIHDWNGQHHKLVDVVTKENHLNLRVPFKNNNYKVTVVADDNVYQLEGKFTSSTIDRFGIIRLDVNTTGNYKKLDDLIIIRDPDSSQKAPKLITMIDGDPYRYKWSARVRYPIEATIGSQLTFDMSESTDENGDTLSFYINGILSEDPSDRFTLNVVEDTYISICASDGFPWTDVENPCVSFELTAL